MLKEARKREESVVVINDVTADTMEAVLKFLYGGNMQEICKDFGMLLGLLDAAGKYGIKSLSDGCEQFAGQLRDVDFDGASVKVLLKAFVLGFRLQLGNLPKRVVDSLKRKNK